MLISEEIKSIALAVLQFACQALVRKSISRKSIIFKFHNYLMEGFMIEQKTLAMPNLYCPTVRM